MVPGSGEDIHLFTAASQHQLMLVSGDGDSKAYTEIEHVYGDAHVEKRNVLATYKSVLEQLCESSRKKTKVSEEKEN